MQIGQAIDAGPDSERLSVCTGFGKRTIDAAQLKIISCWKCPECGEIQDYEN